MAPDLVAHLFGEAEPLFKPGQGLVVVALAGQRQPATEETEKQRHQQVVLSGNAQALGLEGHRLGILPLASS